MAQKRIDRVVLLATKQINEVKTTPEKEALRKFRRFVRKLKEK